MEVKICGLTNVEDARVALEAGADYLGFVLYAKSPRAVTAEKVATIVEKLGGGARAIGVFVNETPESVADVVKRCGLYGAQMHGDEAPGGFFELDFPVWRAVWVKNGVTKPDPASWQAERYVIDAAAPGQYGGSGLTTDWEVASGISRRVPVMLAGGLHPGNVDEAIRQVHPLGVDVSSGVEATVGRKDHDAVRQFVAVAKSALPAM